MHISMIGPHLDAQGGIATVARTWLGAQALQGVDMTYVGTVGSDPNMAKKALDMATNQAKFAARLARGWRPDLFHIHLSYFKSFYRKLAYFEQAHATGRPVLVHLHAPDLDAFHDASPIHAAAMARMFSRASRVVCLSEAMATTVRAWCPAEARLEVIYNPVDMARFDGPNRPPTDHPTVLFMGAIGDRKGTWDLLAAIPGLLTRVPGARFVLAGDGEVDRLRAEVAAMGLGNQVEVPGWVSGDQIRTHYAAADIYCLPSHQEGLPMSILEAMAAGLPVVSTPIAGIPESVIDGQTGFLVPPGDRVGLEARLGELLADAELRATMGEAGRALAAERFDVEVVVTQIRDLWQTVLDEQNPPPGGGSRWGKPR
jgi:glycosyltransferase involved in cell wall biosynthesis